MRALIVAAIAMTASAALAGEIDDAHRMAVSGRDAYWNCLAQEYQRDSNKGMSGGDFTSLIASACPSERQNFRVTLVDFLSLQFPDADFRSAHVHCQQRHRRGAKGYRDRLHQAQGRVEIAKPKC